MPDLDPALARWITAPGEDPQNPLLRTVFDLPAPPVSARLLVTGLGTFRAYLNGAPTSGARLDPGLTDPRRRVQVCDLDVTTLLAAGPNALGIELGRGFHGMRTPNVWRWEQAPWRGPVRAWAHLEIGLADGSSRSIATDEGWRTRPGPIVEDSMYEGETFAPEEAPEAWRLPDYDDSAWHPVLVDSPGTGSRIGTAAPAPLLQVQEQEPVVVQGEFTPAVVSSSPERIVLDMGRVLAGWSRYQLAAEVGLDAEPVEFVARHGEKLRDDGTVDDDNEHIYTDRFQEDRVRLEPAFARSFEPQHSYKGFRFVQLEPLRGDLGGLEVTGVLAHADLAPASTLSSSDTYLERFDTAMRASLANNMHHVPTDTPMHEKNGWTGDALTSLAAMVTSFDMHRMLRKWARDQADTQRADGSLAVIAPTPGWGYEELSPAPEWTTLLPVLLEELAVEYGDTEAVREHGQAAAAYLDYELSRRDEDGLISGVLGDYLTPGSSGPAPEDKRLTATLFVARALRSLAHALELARAADGSGATGDEGAAAGTLHTPDRLRRHAAQLEAAVNAAFLDTAHGIYRDPSSSEYHQTSNLLPLAFGIVPEEHVQHVVAGLVADIEARGGHHDCGHIGVRYLLPVLSAHGHGDLAYRVLCAPTAPGWRAWLEAGNSTFMEMWENPRSCSHYFMGTPVTWIHEHVAGLRRGRDGWREFLVAPDPDVPVGRIALTRRTRHGEIAVEVDREAATVTVTVPAGTRARVVLPGIEQVLEAGRHTIGRPAP
ncbi:family 78 glycoside hydrolase catalytic domain [Brachybacterium sp. GCM10030267]|uniref:family 78 glycoside hydrolase catalytic domain n=1 Tax=unclassified Brachybacterium TaxID=2623841 RepID=UPI00360DC799